jgi:Transposase IS116/IS110/IS902 family
MPEQERPHRCSQAVRVVVSEQAQLGVSRRAGYPNSEGAGAQLHRDDTRFDAGDESAEGHLPKLGIPCAGQQVYAPRYRAEWLAKISEVGVRRRAELYHQQFDALAALRQQARRELLAEARKHPAMKLLRQIPTIGPIRAALLIALMQTPDRFRTKRQLWAYCGLALRTYTSGEYHFVGGQLKRSKKVMAVRGLNINVS